MLSADKTHGDGTVRTVYCGEIIVFRLDSLFLVVKEEIHGSVIAAEQCDGGRLVLSHVFLQRGRSYAPAFCIYGYFCQVVLDGYLRVSSLTGVEEEGSGVNACFRSAFVGQGCFRLGFQSASRCCTWLWSRSNVAVLPTAPGWDGSES